MIASEIISKFELYVDDTTELSTDEELSLLNKIYYQVATFRVWEILKKEASGTMASTTTITLPSDFAFFVENYSYTDNSYSTEINAKPTVIFITSGTARSVVQIINWSDRRQYRDNPGYCYLDLASGTIVFCGAQPSGATYSFDYQCFPTALGLSDTPVFPARFHDIFYHGMAVDDYIIQLFDKAQSYAPENKARYDSYMALMSLYNAQLLNN